MAKKEGIRRLVVAAAVFVWTAIYVIGLLMIVADWGGGDWFGTGWSDVISWTLLMGAIPALAWGINKAAKWIKAGFHEPT